MPPQKQRAKRADRWAATVRWQQQLLFTILLITAKQNGATPRIHELQQYGRYSCVSRRRYRAGQGSGPQQASLFPRCSCFHDTPLPTDCLFHHGFCHELLRNLRAMVRTILDSTPSLLSVFPANTRHCFLRAASHQLSARSTTAHASTPAGQR